MLEEVTTEAKGPLTSQRERWRLARLRIEQHSPIARFARVWLNGMDLTANGGGLMSFAIDFSGEHGMTVATLKIGVDDIEIDAETLIQLQAVYEAKRA